MTFQKLTAGITRFVNTVIEDTSDYKEIGFYQENTENRARCNIARELNKNFFEYKLVVSVRILVQSKLLLLNELGLQGIVIIFGAVLVLTFTLPSD